MKLRAEVFSNEGSNVNKKVGALIYDGKKITTEGIVAKNILSRSIFFKGGDLFAKDDPEAFIRNLFKEYSGTYIRVGKAVEIK